MNNNRSYILLIVIVALATTTTTFVNAKTSIFKPSDLKFKDLVKKYGVKKVVQAHNLRHRAIVHGEKPAAAQETKSLSLLEVAAKTRAQTKITSKGAAGGCEVCVYVVENKQMHQPFLWGPTTKENAPPL